MCTKTVSARLLFAPQLQRSHQPPNHIYQQELSCFSESRFRLGRVEGSSRQLKMQNPFLKLSQDADEVIAVTIAILQSKDGHYPRIDPPPPPTATAPSPSVKQVEKEVDNEHIKSLAKKLADAEDGQRIASIAFTKTRREMELLAARNSALEKELEAPRAEILNLKTEIETLNATVAKLEAELEQARSIIRVSADDSERMLAEKADTAATKEKCQEAIETAKKLSIQSEKRKEQRETMQKERDAALRERDVLQQELNASQEQSQSLRTQLSQAAASADEARVLLEQRAAEFKVCVRCVFKGAVHPILGTHPSNGLLLPLPSSPHHSVLPILSSSPRLHLLPPPSHSHSRNQPRKRQLVAARPPLGSRVPTLSTHAAPRLSVAGGT